MPRFLISIVFATLVAVASFADPAAQAAGYWKSISDVKGEEGKVTALWLLSVDGQGQLQGTIVWAPKSKPDDKYDCKKPEFNGKLVRGTFWMKGLKRNGSDSWTGGTIVDIGNANGDVYGCDVKVTDGGKKLEMRGYLGVALFGRTQTWEAVTEADAKAMISG